MGKRRNCNGNCTKRPDFVIAESDILNGRFNCEKQARRISMQLACGRITAMPYCTDCFSAKELRSFVVTTTKPLRCCVEYSVGYTAGTGTSYVSFWIDKSSQSLARLLNEQSRRSSKLRTDESECCWFEERLVIVRFVYKCGVWSLRSLG
jgi:hypothetical protein